jgi:hypothetical protein
MIVPANLPSLASSDRLASRRIRVGLKFPNSSIADHVLAAGTDLIFGIGGPGVFAVPGWTGPDLCLISRGRWLALGAGMTLHMCHDDGEDRMQGSFEELSQAGVSFPLYINVSRLNIRVNELLSLLMEYTPDQPTPEQPSTG